MTDFVDLHCHALFRVDDGAQTEDVMKKMLDIAYSGGTRHICFTPHFKIYEFNDEDAMYEQVNRLNRRFKVACDYSNEKYPDLHLYLGNEIMFHNEISESLFSKKCIFLNNSSYALVEFSPDSTAYAIENAVVKLLRKGIRPLIAHVERYPALMKDFSLLRVLKDCGALLQVNARSVNKFKFGKAARFLKYAFSKGLIDVIASDAHNDSSFTPDLSKAYAVISKRYGNEYANKIFRNTPLSILMNEKVF